MIVMQYSKLIDIIGLIYTVVLRKVVSIYLQLWTTKFYRNQKDILLLLRLKEYKTCTIIREMLFDKSQNIVHLSRIRIIMLYARKTGNRGVTLSLRRSQKPWIT